ncbi:MAG: hypothetical protein AAF745_01805 [Planctomycetota bacterium]
MNHPTLFRRGCVGLIVLLSLLGVSGCRLCSDEDLCAYPTYGGIWQRTLRESGRVGSVFDPGGARAADLAMRTDAEEADARLRDNVDLNEQEGAELDEAERRRQQEDLDQQLRESERRETDEEAQRRLEQMEERFEGMELEDISTIVVPPQDDWQ